MIPSHCQAPKWSVLHYLKQAYEDGKLQFAGSLEDLAHPIAFNRVTEKARNKKWIVYAKRPFGGPQQVLDYLVVTLTGLRSLTIVCSRCMTGESLSVGRTIATQARPRR